MTDPRGTTVRVLYIAGSGRSGSTLLARILGQVPGLVSAGEVRNLLRQRCLSLPDNLRCGCGEVFAVCPFWTGVRERVERLDPTLDVDRAQASVERVDRIRYLPAIYSPWSSAPFAARLSEVERLLLALYRALLAAGGAEMVVDESKDLSLLYLLGRMRTVDLSILHLVRDSRAVATSWMRRRRRPEFLDEERYMRQDAPLSTALGWWYRNLGAEAARGLGDYQRLRYEDLVARPALRVTSVLERLGIDAAPGLLAGDALDITRADHLATGNPMRLERDRIEIRPDVGWRSEMPAGARRLVTALTLPLLLRYGYPVRTSS